MKTAKGMKQDEIALAIFCFVSNKTYLLPRKKKETPLDQPQPSSLRANPSSSVRTTPNRNLEQSVEFATPRNIIFTAQ